MAEQSVADVQKVAVGVCRGCAEVHVWKVMNRYTVKWSCGLSGRFVDGMLCGCQYWKPVQVLKGA